MIHNRSQSNLLRIFLLSAESMRGQSSRRLSGNIPVRTTRNVLWVRKDISGPFCLGLFLFCFGPDLIVLPNSIALRQYQPPNHLHPALIISPTIGSHHGRFAFKSQAGNPHIHPTMLLTLPRPKGSLVHDTHFQAPTSKLTTVVL